MLFCDLVGFTASSEAADPEDVRARLRPYHQRLREVVERFGGTAEKFVGDAIMAVFGAPVAHEDDAERAVRAGLRILEAIEELNAQDTTLALRVRVGINTGEAVVTLGAKPEEGEGFVTGDVVNTASRLQGAAPVNGVAVSEQTFRATERVFDYEPLDPVTVKGKSEPLPIYRPLAARARLGSDLTRTHAAPLVGRELERPLLIATFERAAQQQSCQLVTVVGEPGVGKSRLCMELFHYAEERAGLIRWRQGRCLPYGEGIAFWALGEIVKAECGILESDPPDEARAKLERALSEDIQDRPWLLARLGPLVGLSGEPAAEEESFTAWRRFLEQLAADEPAVFVFEDLHWGDPALLRFLEHLADWSEGVPLFVLCTARPELHEQHPGWAGGLRNATTINLAPLSDQETAQLVSVLLERAVLPPETHEQVLERAGGNPLYAEEFVRLLVDRGDVSEAVEVPDSVQALIAARLDTLSADRKALLQDAAVVGKVFWAGVLTAMGDRDAGEVAQALHELARKELVRFSRTSSMEGETEYGFWHGLVGDVCYQQIPRAGRADRHRQAAMWIEQKAGERAEDLADVLAHHYMTALDLSRAAGLADDPQLQEKAVHYLGLAGERAFGLDVERAERSLERALELAPPGHTERPALLEQWGLVMRTRARPQEARDAFEEALASSRAAGDNLATGRLLGRLAMTLDGPRAEEAMAESLELLEAEPPGPDLVEALQRLGSMRYVQQSFRKTIEAEERAIALAAQLGLPDNGIGLGDLGGARANLGDPAGLDDMRRAVSLLIANGEGRGAAAYQHNLALVTWLYKGPQAAFAIEQEALDLCRRHGVKDIAHTIEISWGAFLAELGRTEEALAENERAAALLPASSHQRFSLRVEQIHLLTECGEHNHAPDLNELVATFRESDDLVELTWAVWAASPYLVADGKREVAEELLIELDEMATARAQPVDTYCLTGLVRTAVALGRADLALRLVDSLEPYSPSHQACLASCHAQLAEAAGNRGEAATLYADAAKSWRDLGTVPECAYAVLGQGRCLSALGDPAAEYPLSEARDLFASMGYSPALAETQALLQQSQAAAT